VACSLLVALGCSSSTTSDMAVPFVCPKTIDELRAAPPNDGVDYSADFATAQATCNKYDEEMFSSCDGAYDTMDWYSFPDCGGRLFYDHTTGALVAVLGVTPTGGDTCGGYFCVAGPPQFFAAGENCTKVKSCVP
jgi:hypothetical protein